MPQTRINVSPSVLTTKQNRRWMKIATTPATTTIEAGPITQTTDSPAAKPGKTNLNRNPICAATTIPKYNVTCDETNVFIFIDHAAAGRSLR